LEAVSFGCCILTTNIPENLEVVGDSALEFPPDDVTGLRERLREVLESPDLARATRERVAARARSLPDWDGVATLTEELYLRLVGK